MRQVVLGAALGACITMFAPAPPALAQSENKASAPQVRVFEGVG